VPFRVFEDLATQWQCGPLGLKTGLRYEALPVVLAVRRTPRAEWAGLFDALRVMEVAALGYWTRAAAAHAQAARPPQTRLH
jgi:hypothetical protein